jgi:hypothetical protein
MEALFLKGDVSDGGLRQILTVCRSIEQRKQKPVSYSVIEVSPGQRAAQMVTKDEVSFQPVVQPAEDLKELAQ